MRKTVICGMLCLCMAMVGFAAHALEMECVQQWALGSEDANNVMRATLDNGQVIYYLSMDSDARGSMVDVNFDGHDDFVPVVSMGARNASFLFYLYNPQTSQYEPVYTTRGKLVNYELDAARQYVISDMQDGYLYGEKIIYKWEGSELVPVRSATRDTIHTTEYGESSVTESWDSTQYEAIVWDHSNGGQEPSKLYHETYPQDDPLYQEHYDALMEALWAGL